MAEIDLSGRRAIVTGAAQGLGEAIAKGLAALGAQVAVSDLKEDSLRSVVDELARSHGADNIMAAVCDISDTTSTERFVEEAGDQFGGIDILVNNAGLGCGAVRPDFRDAVLTYRTTFDQMNAALIDRRWIAADTFSLADFALIPYVQAMEQMGWSAMFESEHPLVADWFGRAKARPSFAAVILDELSTAGLDAAKAAGMAMRARIFAWFAAAA